MLITLSFQIVCDAENNILWVDERYPGSSHDSYVLLASAITDFANAGNMRGFWILGDSG